MRRSLPVSVPIVLLSCERITEFRYAGASSLGRSDATAISIPNSVETTASTPRPKNTISTRNLRTRIFFSRRRGRNSRFFAGKGTTRAPLPFPLLVPGGPGRVVVRSSNSSIDGRLAGAVRPGRGWAGERTDQARGGDGL